MKKNNIFQSLLMGTFWGSRNFIILSVILMYLFLGNEITSEHVFVVVSIILFPKTNGFFY